MGHMDHMIKKAVAIGMPVEDALLAASYHVAQEANLPQLGAIAPGYAADMVLLNDTTNLQVQAVFYEGKPVCKGQKLLKPIKISAYTKQLEKSELF